MKYVRVGGLWPPQKAVPGLKATGSIELMVAGKRAKIPLSLWANESANPKAPKFNVKVGLPDDVPGIGDVFVAGEKGSNPKKTAEAQASKDDAELF